MTPPDPPDDHPVVRVGVSELRRRPGTRRELRRVVDLGAVEVAGTSVANDGEVLAELVLESLADGVVVTGTVRTDWQGQCRRCLQPTSGQSIAELHEVFKDRPDQVDDPDLGAAPLEGDAVDLGPAVHDAAVLALPLAPLCGPSCRGPAPDEVPVLTDEHPAADEIDPRWAALDELRFDPDDADG